MKTQSILSNIIFIDLFYVQDTLSFLFFCECFGIFFLF